MKKKDTVILILLLIIFVGIIALFIFTRKEPVTPVDDVAVIDDVPIIDDVAVIDDAPIIDDETIIEDKEIVPDKKEKHTSKIETVIDKKTTDDKPVIEYKEIKTASVLFKNWNITIPNETEAEFRVLVSETGEVLDAEIVKSSGLYSVDKILYDKIFQESENIRKKTILNIKYIITNEN